MADVATLEEGVRAAFLGANAVATTLSGYTEETAAPSGAGPDLDLVAALVAALAVPVIAEGRFRTPGEVREAFRLGATPWWSAPRSPIRARSRSGSRPG